MFHFHLVVNESRNKQASGSDQSDDRKDEAKGSHVFGFENFAVAF